MKLHPLACAFAERWTGWNREPLTLLAFVPVMLALIAVGAALGQTQLFLLIITTALSIDASLTGRMGLLKQAQAAGEVEMEDF